MNENDSINIKKLNKILKNKPFHLIFINKYPGDVKINITSSQLDNLLLKLNYKAINYKTFIHYIPKK
jgi:hypothetical protein